MQRSDGQQHQLILKTKSLNAELQCKMQKQDEEDADVSEHVVPMTLREARVAAHALKVFVQENQSIEAFHPFLVQFERFSREVDAVTVSARTEQSTIHHFFQPVHAADGISPTAGARAD